VKETNNNNYNLIEEGKNMANNISRYNKTTGNKIPNANDSIDGNYTLDWGEKNDEEMSFLDKQVKIVQKETENLTKATTNNRSTKQQLLDKISLNNAEHYNKKEH
jgi:hypothetical protein